MAERVGFEPTRGYRPLRAFQARLFGHSSTSPLLAENVGFEPTIRWRDATTRIHQIEPRPVSPDLPESLSKYDSTLR